MQTQAGVLVLISYRVWPYGFITRMLAMAFIDIAIWVMLIVLVSFEKSGHVLIISIFLIVFCIIATVVALVGSLPFLSIVRINGGTVTVSLFGRTYQQLNQIKDCDFFYFSPYRMFKSRRYVYFADHRIPKPANVTGIWKAYQKRQGVCILQCSDDMLPAIQSLQKTIMSFE